MQIFAKITKKKLADQFVKSAKNVVRAINSESQKEFNRLLAEVAKKVGLPKAALKRKKSFVKRATIERAVFEALTYSGTVPWKYSKYQAYRIVGKGRPKQIVKFNRFNNGAVAQKVFRQKYFGIKGIPAPVRVANSNDEKVFHLNRIRGDVRTRDKRLFTTASRTPIYDLSIRNEKDYEDLVDRIYKEWLRLDKIGL